MILLKSVLFIGLSSLGLMTRAQNTVLSGELKGLSGGTVKIFYNQGGISVTDTVKAIGDVFTWKANLPEPVRIALTAGPSNYYFFAEPGNIRLTGVKDSTQSYILTGSPMQQDANTFDAFTRDLTHRWDSLYSLFKNAPLEQKAAINKQREDVRKQQKIRVAEFISSHPAGYFSMYLIELENDYQEIKRLYNKLDASAMQTSTGKRIAGRLAKLANSQIGTIMTDFAQADTSGNPVSFNRFKGRYVLVDFWASWCMPCRAENPNVLKAYQAFKDKGFTIVGISLDDVAANWKKAIRDDNLPWTQLSDLKGWKNEISVHFGIQAIPANLLVDPSGKIVAKDLRGAALENTLKELLK